jgi:hypothetical protein
MGELIDSEGRLHFPDRETIITNTQTKERLQWEARHFTRLESMTGDRGSEFERETQKRAPERRDSLDKSDQTDGRTNIACAVKATFAVF